MDTVNERMARKKGHFENIDNINQTLYSLAKSYLRLRQMNNQRSIPLN